MCCRPTAFPTGATVLGAVAEPEHIGVQFNRTDLEFILQQILMAEAGQPPVSPHLAFGLREVAGTNNSTDPGNSLFGSSDQAFLRQTDALFQSADGGTSYSKATGFVIDADPRMISNLIVDQTANNPARSRPRPTFWPGWGPATWRRTIRTRRLTSRRMAACSFRT